MSDPNGYQRQNVTHTFFTDKATTGRGAEDFLVAGCQSVAVFISAAEVTSGATLLIEAKRPDGEYHVIDTIAITENGNAEVPVIGNNAFSEINVNISARTDGEYTVQAEARI